MSCGCQALPEMFVALPFAACSARLTQAARWLACPRALLAPPALLYIIHLCFEEPRHPESAFHFSLRGPPNAAWHFRASHPSLNPSLHTWPTLYGGWPPFQTFAPPNSNPAFDSSTGMPSVLPFVASSAFLRPGPGLSLHTAVCKHVYSKQQHVCEDKG